ncbi:BTAD domain-containing putative transcriptional regulator [Streptomyces sp. NPDC018972]|uniref:AfsR/SARP family transcriptional regulator n=1 Tax=Streptomyces sp. NPDC018972 TaxID=3365060 RepID=UPI0037A8FB17
MDFRILGAVSAEREGRAVALDGSKQRSVLAALLLAHGKVMTDERLTTLLWGWDPPVTSTNQLYTYASRLRTRMGPGIVLERTGPGYRLDIGDAALDWEAFRELAQAGGADLREGRYADAERRLASALSLWNGPALTGVTEHLAQAEVPRLEEARLSAVEQHAEAALALGRHTETVTGLTREVALHPGSERLRALLMTALHRCGRQADALATYAQGRRYLADELGIDPGPALRALHEQILTGELSPAPAPRPGHGTAARPGPAPQPPPEPENPPRANGTGASRTARAAPSAPGAPAAGGGWPGMPPALLPAAPYDFVGRVGEVRELLEALGERRDVVITGTPGTGKSALALHAAERCRDTFPQGQLYADLRTEDGPRRPVEVLGWFLRALGVPPGRLPVSLEERVQLYRTLSNGRRMLIVLDNATDDAQVRPLLPGGGASRTVVTGVHAQLASLEGTCLLRLGPLEPAEAVRLLATVAGTARIGQEAEAVARIAEFCDRLPLALRIAAARIATRPQGSATRLAARLESAERRLDELRLGSLDVGSRLRHALNGLPSPAVGAFLALAAAAPPLLTALDAASVLGTGTEDAEDLLEQLVDGHLLEGGGVDGSGRPRYHFPSLIRLFGRHQGAAVRTAA